MLFHLFIFTTLFFSTLNSCEFNSCLQKVVDSKSYKQNHLQILVDYNKHIVYSKTKPNAKILKHNPFLSLYLVEVKDSFKYPFFINLKLNKKVAFVDDKHIYKVKLLKEQVGLNNFAKFNKNVDFPKVLLSSCGFLEGILTSRGVIDKDYLYRFINYNFDYSDIGVRVKEVRKNVVISAINPFYIENKLSVGDIILSLDGKKVINSSTFMKKVLFLKINSLHTIEVKHKDKVLKLNVKAFKRYGGGYISDTFLEQKGIYFDENLFISSLTSRKFGLELGDKLIQVNGKKVTTTKDVLTNISSIKDKEFISLLFTRNGFEFFINIELKNDKTK